MTWGLLPVPYRVPALLDFPLFTIYGTQFPGLSRLHAADLGADVRRDLARPHAHPHRPGHPGRAAPTPRWRRALGHNVPRVFTIVFAAGTALAGLAGVIGGNYQVTEPAMAFTMGPIVFVVVVFGGLGSLAGCFIASLLMGLIQTFAVVLDVSLADLLAKFGLTVTSRHAVRRGADGAPAADRRAAALPDAGPDPGVQAARPDGDARHMSTCCAATGRPGCPGCRHRRPARVPVPVLRLDARAAIPASC